MERENTMNMKEMTEKCSPVLQKKPIKRQYSGATRKLEHPLKENKSEKKRALQTDSGLKRRRIENSNSAQTQFEDVALQQHNNIPQHNNNSSTSFRRPSIQNSDRYLQDFRIEQKNGGTVLAPNILGATITGGVTINQKTTQYMVSQMSRSTSNKNGNQDSLGLTKAKGGQKSNLSDFLKSVIDVAVESKNEHLDLFNCFLFGISCDSSRCLLEGLLPRLEDSSLEDHKKVTKYIKSLRRKVLSPERCFSLVRCIVELKDRSFLKMPNLERTRTKKPLTLFQCTILAFQFVMSDTDHDEFVLRKFNITLEGFQRFSPAITCFRKAMLKGSGFTEKHCDVLVPFLTSPNSHLTHLDLSHNSLGLSALKQLSRAFCDPKCQIQILNLSHNDLHGQDMELIKDVLSGPNVNLKILDLSDNHLEDEGVKILSAGLRSAKCHLEVLKLSGCQIKGDLKLLSSLKASLRELDLQYNDLGNIMEKKVNQLKHKLPSLRIYTGGVCSHQPGLYKYAVELTFDPQTSNEYLNLNENNTVAVRKRERQQLPANAERFDKCNQVLCCQPLLGRCFFAVDVIGTGVHVGVACKGIKRKGANDTVRLGRNKMSWCLCFSKNVSVAHDKKTESLTKPLQTESTRKLCVFLDREAGCVSFYRLSPDSELELLYIFDADFPEDQEIYAAFSIQEPDSSVSLRQASL
ncbi:hypothetical protein QQF64_019422 [Cirrhinus molitorella]|uniref:B30.2/SPRY domain-containing protein n=1 Tax=Cirrhinus molitorella TaxID=172907 RepID=A0ABR3LHQ4_9TELE